MKASKRLSASTLASELVRLNAAQRLMREANVALAAGDLAALHAMGFSEEHVVQLQRPTMAGTIGFPGYALTNNEMTIGALQRALKRTYLPRLVPQRGGRVSEPRTPYRVAASLP